MNETPQEGSEIRERISVIRTKYLAEQVVALQENVIGFQVFYSKVQPGSPSYEQARRLNHLRASLFVRELFSESLYKLDDATIIVTTGSYKVAEHTALLADLKEKQKKASAFEATIEDDDLRQIKMETEAEIGSFYAHFNFAHDLGLTPDETVMSVDEVLAILVAEANKGTEPFNINVVDISMARDINELISQRTMEKLSAMVADKKAEK